MIITVTLNPALDKTLILPGFAVNTVNRVQDSRLDPGGKGINVSKSVQALGGSTLAIGVLGGASGGYIKAALDQLGLANDMVITGSTTRTNLKIMDPVLGTNTDINEPGSPISEADLHKVWQKLSDAVKPGDTVVFAGKNPPEMDDGLLAEWIHRLKSLDVRVCVDTVGEPMRLALQEKPDIIKPNRDELSGLTGRALRKEADIIAAARELVDGGVGLVAVSLGGDGALFMTADQCIRGRCPKVAVASTVGAGDAMMAALAHYSGAGCSLEETARRAVAVATATVMYSGTKPAELTAILPMIDRVRIEYL